MKKNSKSFYITRVVCLFFVYFITAKIGLQIDAVSGFATLIWPPTGIALAFLLIFGYRMWPGIFLGAFLVNLSTGAPIFVALGIAIGNTLEAISGVFLLRRFVDFKNNFEELKSVIGFVLLAAFLSTTVSATIGSTSLLLGNFISKFSYLSTWTAWWLGDMLGALIVTPAILVWSKKITRKDIEPSRIIESIGLFVSLMITGGIIFRGFLNVDTKGAPIIYLTAIPLVWASLRFGSKGAIATIFFLSVIATTSTIQGMGPFVRSRLSESLFFLQTYIGTTAITYMILSSVVEERIHLSKRKDEFISIVSHELKTPITTIKGYTQLLKKILRGKNNENEIKYIEKMDSQVNRLTGLVNDLLDVSKIQTEKLDLNKEKFLIYDLVKNIVEDMQQISKHKIILEGKVRKKVFADNYRISQVLMNLISNAIKFSPKKDKIIVTTVSDKESVTISVQDFGIGIAKKDQDKVFGLFYQTGTKKQHHLSGLGLGLYICADIVKRHGGNIWVESKKGKGSTFSFNLPVI